MALPSPATRRQRQPLPSAHRALKVHLSSLHCSHCLSSCWGQEGEVSQLTHPPLPTACLPGIKVCNRSEELGTWDEMLQLCPDFLKMRPPHPIVWPATLHEFIEDRWAIHRRGEPVSILQAFHYLHRGHREIWPRAKSAEEEPETSGSTSQSAAREGWCRLHVYDTGFGQHGTGSRHLRDVKNLRGICMFFSPLLV